MPPSRPGLRTLGYLTLDTAPGETIAAAAAAGFGSVGIRITGRRRSDPYTDVLGNAATIADLRRHARDGGIRISNISAYHLYDDVTVDDLARITETTAALDSTIVVANVYLADTAQREDALGAWAQRAAGAGVRIALEFMRYSRVKTLDEARALVEAVNNPALGLLVDPLHLARSGGTPEALARVPADDIVFVQLCDAKAAARDATDDELRQEARTGRLYPGDGVLPLRAFVAALPPGMEIEFEVPRRDLGELTLVERAKVARSVFDHFLDAV